MILGNKMLEVKAALLQYQDSILAEFSPLADTLYLDSKKRPRFLPFYELRLAKKSGDHAVLVWGIRHKGFFGKDIFTTRVFEDNLRDDQPRWTVTTTIHDDRYRKFLATNLDRLIHSRIRSVLCSSPEAKYNEKII